MRTAVIGLGRMGVRHLQAARNLGMEIMAVVDVSEAALAAAQSAHGLTPEQCFTDVTKMLAATRLDAVVVATTAPTHAPFVIQSAQADVRYILCEKPMATSLTEAEAMRAACQATGAKLAINHQMRFMAQYTEIKALIGSDRLGPLASVIVAGSNFGLAMNACHYFEMFRYVSGRQIHSVQAWLDNELLPNPRGAQFEDRSGRLIAWGESDGSGAAPAMYLDIAATAGHGLNVVYICRYGQIIVDELAGWVRVIHRKPEFRELPTTRYGMPAETSELAIEPADVIVPTMDVWSAMLAGAPFPDHDVGLHAMKALVAAHVSHDAGGRKIRLDEPSLPVDRQFKWA